MGICSWVIGVGVEGLIEAGLDFLVILSGVFWGYGWVWRGFLKYMRLHGLLGHRHGLEALVMREECWG